MMRRWWNHEGLFFYSREKVMLIWWVIMEVDAFCMCVYKIRKKRNRREKTANGRGRERERGGEKENEKKMLTGRVMIVFLCFPSSAAGTIPINWSYTKEKKETNQYDSFSLSPSRSVCLARSLAVSFLSIKQSSSPLSFSPRATRPLYVYF